MRIGLLALCVLAPACFIKPDPPGHRGDAGVEADHYDSVSLGGRHACAIDQGALYCWGDDRAGQLGIATPEDALLSPTRVDPSTSWTQVSAGGTHTCGLNAGKVLCWGDGRYGAVLGTLTGPTPMPVATPFPANAPAFEQISAGQAATCAVGSGELWCWGSVVGTQITAPARIDMRVWTSISIGAGFQCGVVGTDVYCFGANGSRESYYSSDGVITVPTLVGGGLPPVQRVVAGNSQACAITASGQLWCWGYNGDGLIQPGGALFLPPTRVDGSSGWTDIALGQFSACGKRDSEMICWGGEHAGGLGDGLWGSYRVLTMASQLGPADAIAIGIVPADAQSTERVCKRVGATVSCWGDNPFGELGLGTRSAHPTPVLVPPPEGHWTLVGAGLRHTCAATESQLYCWGAEDTGQVSGAIPSVGVTSPCTPGNCDRPLPFAAPPMGAIDELGVGNDFTCARAGTKVTCWGNDMYGQLGTPQVGHVARTVPGDWTVLFGGPRGTCGRVVGEPQPYCWGRFGPGIDLTPTILANANLTMVHSLSPADDFVCGITAATQRVCWGMNGYGQCGDSTTMELTMPTPIGPPNVTMVAAAGWHGCLITNSIPYCWGYDTAYQTGQPSGPTVSATQVLAYSTGMAVTGCSVIATGPEYSCAACGDKVECWGQNDFGQLGRPHSQAMRYRADAAELPGGHGWTQLALGEHHACVLDGLTHELYCWGDGPHGQLGDGGHAVNLPTPLGPRSL